ncbi:TIR domain-containing protein [Parafrankia sp. EUN1f]|uniref:TIR domain-containing protein n=1 Tax=Parafrankia sp. EUN1f TaxID=102897 RepID=UPI0001C451D3|nr:TIR domain-containing protein [Parafrankia sp. EUN1f]EFC83288.1 hypothetical protein FrEUN1fDRAFT_3562 [Parafrankia sp. EUN1f]
MSNGVNTRSTSGSGVGWDFFVSYTQPDRPWAEWIAWTLEDAGYRVLIQAWDFTPGSNWVTGMDQGVAAAARTIAVLSAAYTGSVYGAAEWQAAWSADPTGATRKLLVARVEDCPRPGLLGQVVSLDLYGIPQNTARTDLLRTADLAVSGGRAKPAAAPPYPSRTAISSPPFPEPDADSGPPGGIRVRDARGRALGVHASIRAEGSIGELPEYVPRDVDYDLDRRLSAGKSGGCFVLLMGGSSVGKTRTIFEAMRRIIPDWWIATPSDSNQVRDLAERPHGKVVVWLDEVRRFLDSPVGLLSAVHHLLQDGAILLATVWRDDYTSWVSPTGDHPDPYAEHRQIIDLAHIIDIPEDLSEAERARAEARAKKDPRLRLALNSEDQGVIQVIAAGPDLVRRWDQAPNPYGKAIITAAVDVRRLGARTPPSRALLEALAPAYLKPTELALASPDWFEQAVQYATAQVRRAAAALAPVGERIGHTAGYIVADYLYQYASRLRRSETLSDAAWQTIATYHDPSDTHRLAEAATRRLRYEDCEAIYLRAIQNGDTNAARKLIDNLTTESRIDDAIEIMRRYKVACSGMSAVRIADYLITQNETEEAISHLHAHVGRCGFYVLNHLISTLCKLGRTDEAIDVLRPHADAYVEPTFAEIAAQYSDPARRPSSLVDLLDSMPDGSPDLLAKMLAEKGNIEELLQREKNGDKAAADRLDRLLAEERRIDDLYARLNGRGYYTATLLAKTLISTGRRDEALSLLRERADGGDHPAALMLAQQLGESGQIQELQQRADGGDEFSASELADRLAAQGDLDKLQARAREGEDSAFIHVLNHFLETPSEEGLHIIREIAATRTYPSIELAMILARMDKIDELELMAESGDKFIAGRLADTYERLGMTEKLKARADSGDTYAAGLLLDLIEGRGGIKELVTEVDAGTHGAAERLIRILSDEPRRP